MALTSCPECNEQISDAAFDCPKCGATLRKPTRTLFGKIAKWAFIGFNVLMLVWLVVGLGAGGEVVQGAKSEAEAAGAAIGTGIGVMLIISTWVSGDFLLGIIVLLTRPSKN